MKRISIKKSISFVLLLAFISPLGLIIPDYFDSQGAWGEWDSDGLQKITGYVPEGYKKFENIWKAPLKGYLLFEGKGIVMQSLGYFLSGIIGLAVIFACYKVLSRLTGKKGEGDASTLA